MAGEARRKRGVLFGVLAVSALALLAGPASIATAETKVKTVPAEVVSEWKYNPSNPLACGALAFVRWQGPPLKPAGNPSRRWSARPHCSSSARQQATTNAFFPNVDDAYVRSVPAALHGR